jgi:hypothetical protein
MCLFVCLFFVHVQYVCIYIHVHVCVRMCLDTNQVHVREVVCVCGCVGGWVGICRLHGFEVCLCVCMCVCVCARACIHMETYQMSFTRESDWCNNSSIYMYVCMYVYMCIYIYIYTYIYSLTEHAPQAGMHAYIHTYTYIHRHKHNMHSPEIL